MVRCDGELVPELLKRFGFFPDSHMTTIVRKETGRRNHQNLVLHGRYSTAALCLTQQLPLDNYTVWTV
jgi:hypothetical protein